MWNYTTGKYDYRLINLLNVVNEQKALTPGSRKKWDNQKAQTNIAPGSWNDNRYY